MTKQETTYNGWTNYATWRVNLEFFDDCDWVGVTDATDDRELAEELQASLEMYIDESVNWPTRGNSLVRDWVNAFVSDVNFYEIASHIIEEKIKEEISNV